MGQPIPNLFLKNTLLLTSLTFALSLVANQASEAAYTASASKNSNLAKCPAIAELSKSLDEFKGAAKVGSGVSPLSSPSLKCTNGADLPPNNIKLLSAAANIPPEGGYQYKGEGAKPLNFDLDPCAGDVSSMMTMKEDGSYCSGGPYAALLIAFKDEICASGTFDKQRFGLGSRLFETLNNDGTQMGDLAPALDIGSVLTQEPGQEVMTNLGVCPGDFVNFSRPINESGKMYGHAAMLMGVIEGKMYWWSSQSASNGWGIDCVEVDKIASGDFAVTRVERPENLTNYDIAKLNGKGDGDKIVESKKSTTPATHSKAKASAI